MSPRQSISQLSPEALRKAKRNAAIRLRGDVIELTPVLIDELKRLAAESPLQRARYCLHPGDESLTQEMVIALTDQCYLRPHRHRRKAESFCILEGELDVVFLDDSGRESRRIEMGAVGNGRVPVYRLASSLWHAVIPQTRMVLFCETTDGPYDPSDTEFPVWAPEETDAIGVTAFSTFLRKGR